MLLQIRDFIQRETFVSSQQLCREFRIDISALKPMLDLWVKKGQIEPCQQKSGCASKCGNCKQSMDYYQIKKN